MIIKNLCHRCCYTSSRTSATCTDVYKRQGFSQRNMVIVSLSLSVGLGFTSATGMFNIFPELVRTVFADNCVAVVFLLAVILNLVLPKNLDKA